jgi:hypothetical protein
MEQGKEGGKGLQLQAAAKQTRPRVPRPRVKLATQDPVLAQPCMYL